MDSSFQFSVLCFFCFFFFIVGRRSVSVSCVFGLTIPDCPFGFLQRLHIFAQCHSIFSIYIIIQCLLSDFVIIDDNEHERKSGIFEFIYNSKSDKIDKTMLKPSKINRSYIMITQQNCITHLEVFELTNQMITFHSPINTFPCWYVYIIFQIF